MTDINTVAHYREAPWPMEGYSADYEGLLRPDGSMLACLSEPEDRKWYRDLAPVITELNALLDRLALAEPIVRYVAEAACMLVPGKSEPSQCFYCAARDDNNHTERCLMRRATEWIEARAALAERGNRDGVEAMTTDIDTAAQELREEHKRWHLGPPRGAMCDSCKKDWPCPTIRLLDRLADLERRDADNDDASNLHEEWCSFKERALKAESALAAAEARVTAAESENALDAIEAVKHADSLRERWRQDYLTEGAAHDATKAQLAQARAALHEHEWCQLDSEGKKYCPDCGHLYPDHQSDCGLNEILAQWEFEKEARAALAEGDAK